MRSLSIVVDWCLNKLCRTNFSIVNHEATQSPHNRTSSEIKYGCVRQFLNHGLETPECPICCESYVTTSSYNKTSNSLVRIKACGHYFHRDCLARWVDTEAKNTCPTCRYKLYANNGPNEDTSEGLDAGGLDLD